MSDDDKQPTGEQAEAQLGPMPAAGTQEPELAPGGADAIDDPRYGAALETPTVPDADPARNPAVEDAVPDEITQPDDKPQAGDDDAASLATPGSHDDGAPEPPA